MKAESVAAVIENDIASGRYQAGERLPTVRAVAEVFNVCAGTALAAFRLLINRRVIYARPGSGYYIVTGEGGDSGEINLCSSPGNSGVKDFLMPSIVAYTRAKGIYLDNSDIEVVDGIVGAVDFAIQWALKPGDGVIVETPANSAPALTYQAAGHSARAVPLSSAGIDVSALEAAIKRKKPTLVHVSPYKHTPAGVVYSVENKSALLALSRKYDFIILEHGGEGDHRPLKAMDGERVIYTADFSKAFGARFGFIIAPKQLINHGDLLETKHDLSCGAIDERVAAFCAAAKSWAGIIDYSLADYGSAWCKLSQNADALRLADECARRGVKVLPGAVYSLNGGKSPYFRVSLGAATPAQIYSGVEIITTCAKEILGVK